MDGAIQKLITKDNNLIDACFNLSAVEQKVMLLGIANARDLKELTSETPVKVTVQNYIDQFGADSKSAYSQIKEAVDHLFNRYFTYFNPQVDDYTRSRWVYETTYMNEKGFVYIFFTPIVIKMIHTLESHFTKYHLDQVSNFKSKYSLRIFELVIKWLNVGITQKYEITDFRRKLGLENNEYTSIAYLKRDVIDKAVKEINSKSDLNISYEQFKDGRTITHIQFKVQKKATANKIATAKTIKLTPKQVDMFADKLSRDPLFQRHYQANVGEEREAYAKRIASKLQDDFYQNEWLSFLIEAGFKPRYAK